MPIHLCFGTTATSALEGGGSREDIIQRLLSLPQANPGIASVNGGASSSSNNEAQQSTSNQINGRAEQDAEMKDETTEENGNEGSTSGETDGGEERDAETEHDIAEEIAKVDALSAYDINLDKEIEAINEYLSMLDASQESV